MKATSNFNVSLGVFLAAGLALFSQSAQAGIAGHVQFVNGQVQVTDSSGQIRNLQKRDAVHESDTVITARESSAQIRMEDGGMIAVRPDSRLKFDSFVFTGVEDGKERAFFSLIRGGFRAITGMIGQKNKASYRIATAASTIGIRGTDHETYVVVPGSELAAIAPVGTYNKVNAGETVITTEKGTIHVHPNQMGFAAASGEMPQLQPVNLKIFTAVPSPAPQSSGGQTIAGEGRESTVVDSAVQQQNVAPGNVVPPTPTLRPIVEERGQTAAPRVF